MLQHVDMKHLKEKCDIGDKDELQQNTAARTPMKKEQDVVCDMYSNICSQKNQLNKFIQKEHTELRKKYCGKIFRNRNEVDTHTYEVCESTCHECRAKDEVENNKKCSIVGNADLILKKDMEHNRYPQYEREL